MESIYKKITVNRNTGEAFGVFVSKLNEWWPGEYTWSGEKLNEIRIDGKKNGLCSEIGPHGFRCDWGRVTEFVENKRIVLKWQISPNREPVPDPEYASEIKIKFTGRDYTTTLVEFEHSNFENHGSNAGNYRSVMNSQQGWDYILACYRKYCNGE